MTDREKEEIFGDQCINCGGNALSCDCVVAKVGPGNPCHEHQDKGKPYQCEKCGGFFGGFKG